MTKGCKLFSLRSKEGSFVKQTGQRVEWERGNGGELQIVSYVCVNYEQNMISLWYHDYNRVL